MFVGLLREAERRAGIKTDIALALSPVLYPASDAIYNIAMHSVNSNSDSTYLRPSDADFHLRLARGIQDTFAVRSVGTLPDFKNQLANSFLASLSTISPVARG